MYDMSALCSWYLQHTLCSCCNTLNNKLKCCNPPSKKKKKKTNNDEKQTTNNTTTYSIFGLKYFFLSMHTFFSLVEQRTNTR